MIPTGIYSLRPAANPRPPWCYRYMIIAAANPTPYVYVYTQNDSNHITAMIQVHNYSELQLTHTNVVILVFNHSELQVPQTITATVMIPTGKYSLSTAASTPHHCGGTYRHTLTQNCSYPHTTATMLKTNGTLSLRPAATPHHRDDTGIQSIRTAALYPHHRHRGDTYQYILTQNCSEPSPPPP